MTPKKEFKPEPTVISSLPKVGNNRIYTTDEDLKSFIENRKKLMGILPHLDRRTKGRK